MTGYTPDDKGIYSISLVDLGNRLQNNFGLTIREHPAFDPVDGKHSSNSYHYIPGGGAIDIQDWRGGPGSGTEGFDGISYIERTKNLRDLLKGSGAEVIGPGDLPDHETHLHLAGFDDGKNVRLNESQYQYLFGGNAGGKGSLFTGITTSTNNEPSTDPPTPKKVTPLSPAQVNAQYDKMRMAGDALGARNFGMKEHKRLFNKR